MTERTKHLRNALIVVLLALVVWLVPGGGFASATIANLLFIVLLAGIVFFSYRLYMEHRSTLFDLPDRLRVILYASAAILLITIVATGRMWNSGGAYVLLWFALIGAAAYGFAAVIRHWREY